MVPYLAAAGATGMISAFLSINPALIRGNQIKRLSGEATYSTAEILISLIC